jgi:protein TonB
VNQNADGDSVDSNATPVAKTDCLLLSVRKRRLFAGGPTADDNLVRRIACVSRPPRHLKRSMDQPLIVASTTLRTGAAASSWALKGWTISCGVHLAAFGAVTIGGLYTPAQIASRGGPMTIQAMSSAASAGDLDGEFLSPIAMDAEVNNAIEPEPEPAELPLEQVEVEIELPPLELSPEDIQSGESVASNDERGILDERQPKERESDEPLLEKTANSDALKAHEEQSEAAVAARARAREHARAKFDSIGSLPSAGSIGHNGNEGKTPPSFAQNAPIPYPPDAIRASREGRVVLRLHIDSQGRVVSADLVKSSGYAILDAAASQGVLQWRAEPARLFGRPVSTTALLPVVFTLR